MSECAQCYRHVCLKCQWYRMAHREAGMMPCPRCESAEAVVVRTMTHRSGNCRVKPPRRYEVCQFCGHEGESRYMTEVPGEGWECNGTYRCLKRQEEQEGALDSLDDWFPTSATDSGLDAA